MADTAAQASLFSECWKAYHGSFAKFWPQMLLISLLVISLDYVLTGILLDPRLVAMLQQYPELRHNPSPEVLKAHPEFVALREHIGLQLLYSMWLLYVPAQIVAYYWLLGGYLRTILPEQKITLNINNFFYWLGRSIWKYLRPVLWYLIPIVGAFFYLRSIIRYATVSPMAILHQQPELKNGWQLTEGHWWRIFLSQIGVTLTLFLAVFVILFLLSFIILLAFRIDSSLTAAHVLIAILQGLMAGPVLMMGVIFSCTVYQVLSREKPRSENLPQFLT